MWERQMDGGRWMKTSTLIHNFFFSWPSHAVLSSRLLLAFLLLLSWVYSTGGLLWVALLYTAPVGCLVICWHSFDCKLRLTQDLHWQTACISCRHLHISFHNTHTFPLNHVTVSAYFHWCILSRQSLIDGSVKRQYTILTLSQVLSFTLKL